MNYDDLPAALPQAKHPKSPKLLNRRNWCLVSAAQAKLSQPAWAGEEGALVFTLRVEDPEDQKAPPEQFHTIVPPLVLMQVCLSCRPCSLVVGP